MGAAYGGHPGVDVQLGEDAFGVGTQGVERDVELAGDLRSGQIAVEEPQHVELAVTERVGQPDLVRRGCRLLRDAGSVEEAASVLAQCVVLAGAVVGGVVQQGEHQVAFVEEEARVAVRLGRLGQRSVQVGEGLLPVSARLVGESSQHSDLDQAACTVGIGVRAEPVEQRQRVAE